MVGDPASVVPSGTMLSLVTLANGPITQSAPTCESQPMNVNGWTSVSWPIVTPSSM